jgi:hypothetical protein
VERSGGYGRIWVEVTVFLRIELKKQGSKMALNGFLFEKRVAIAESMVAQQEGCF